MAIHELKDTVNSCMATSYSKKNLSKADHVPRSGEDCDPFELHTKTTQELYFVVICALRPLLMDSCIPI